MKSLVTKKRKRLVIFFIRNRNSGPTFCLRGDKNKMATSSSLREVSRTRAPSVFCLGLFLSSTPSSSVSWLSKLSVSRRVRSFLWCHAGSNSAYALQGWRSSFVHRTRRDDEHLYSRTIAAKWKIRGLSSLKIVEELPCSPPFLFIFFSFSENRRNFENFLFHARVKPEPPISSTLTILTTIVLKFLDRCHILLTLQRIWKTFILYNAELLYRRSIYILCGRSLLKWVYVNFLP